MMLLYLKRLTGTFLFRHNLYHSGSFVRPAVYEPTLIYVRVLAFINLSTSFGVELHLSSTLTLLLPFSHRPP